MSNSVYPAQPLDRGSLFQLDLKCYDYPLTMEHWGQIISDDPGSFTNFSCEVFKRNSTILGYFVYSDEEESLDDLFILRLGVLPSVRKQGVGSMLIEKIRDVCERKELAQAQLAVPEYCLDPEEGRGLVQFNKANGIAYYRREAEVYEHYGRKYDQIVYRTGGKREAVST